jgi:hypothetical protein
LSAQPALSQRRHGVVLGGVFLKVRIVSYSRNFSLGKEAGTGNERFDLQAEVREEEDPEQVLGHLFLNVNAIEDTLNRYRKVLWDIARAEEEISTISDETELKEKTSALGQLKVERASLLKRIKEGRFEEESS